MAAPDNKTAGDSVVGANSYARKLVLGTFIQGWDPTIGTGADEFGVPVVENMDEQNGEQAGVWDQSVVPMSAAGTPAEPHHGPTTKDANPYPDMPGAE